MSRNQTLREFANNHWVKKVPTLNPINVNETEQEIALFKKAGFDELTQIKTREIQETRSKNRQAKKIKDLQGRILLHKPKFEKIELYLGLHVPLVLSSCISLGGSFLFIILPGYWCLLGIILAFVGVVMGIFFDGSSRPRIKFGGIKLGNQFLASISPSKYTGYVPTHIAETVVQAIEQGFEPEIWTIASKNDLRHLIKAEKIIPYDPLLVGFHEDLKDYVVLLAVWGNDLNDLDEYLGQNHSSN